ncbi:hypothetical protein [Wenjunlia tyrosinilytica]|uniref:hypothetical protein n=1 Tax=Wenjunlia tyrosinilytica TaxID=1544741 RepID=UPI0016685FCF|nr:hypothetical protein [Wenjunlia tyrosinilytica]
MELIAGSLDGERLDVSKLTREEIAKGFALISPAASGRADDPCRPDRPGALRWTEDTP